MKNNKQYLKNAYQKLSLKDAVKFWEEHADNLFLYTYLHERENSMGSSTLSSYSIIWLLNKLKEYGLNEVHPYVISHKPSFSAYDKQKFLTNSVVQKTLTIKLADKLILCSGLGDFKVSKGSLIEIGDSLGISKKKSKESIINPEYFLPEKELGLEKGMVSTFLPPNKDYNISAIFFLSEEDIINSDVAVSLSLSESLVISNTFFKDILNNYAKFAYPNISSREYNVKI